MYAVYRETFYDPEKPIYESEEFQEFQRLHAEQKGYKGTIVTDVGEGRFLTVTLWETAADMDNARQALGPTVQRLIDPLMRSPSNLLGTGQVVVNDIDQINQI